MCFNETSEQMKWNTAIVYSERLTPSTKLNLSYIQYLAFSPPLPGVFKALHRLVYSTYTWTYGSLHVRVWKEGVVQQTERDRYCKRKALIRHRDVICESVECGGCLQWINTVDRWGSLCLECAIGTHSSPVETEAWSQGCLLSLHLDKQHRHRTGGLSSTEGLAWWSAPST